MNLLFSLLTEIVTTFILIAVLITINTRSTKTYIRNLLQTFISYGVLIVVSLVNYQIYTSPLIQFIIFFLLYLTCFYAVKSAIGFFQIQFSKYFYILAALIYFVIALILTTLKLDLYSEAFGYILLGLSLIFLGTQWVIREVLNNKQNKAIGIIFILFGTHCISFLFFMRSENLFISGYYIAALLEMFLTFFIIKAYFIEALDNYILQTDKYVNFFENSSDAILLIRQAKIIDCNTRASKMFQLSKEEIIGKKVSDFSPLYQANGLKSIDYETVLLSNVMPDSNQHFEWIHKANDGSEIYCEVSLFQISKNTTGSLIHDITFTLVNKEALNFHKNFDILTKLPKRSLFIDRLNRALEINEYTLALLAIDISNFKSINDQYGHEFGDQVLIKVTDLLKLTLGDQTTMTRLGGDEFIILLENLKNQEKIIKIINSIEKIFKNGISLNDTLLNTSVCIGVVFPDDMNVTSIDLLKNVDLALNQAKKKGRGKIEFYSKTGYEQFNLRITLEKEMIDGIQNDEFIPYFQPIVDAKTEQIIGAEALMRWIRHDGKQIYPDVFIPIAEDTSLIIDMGETILRQACLACLEVLNYIPEFTVNVNLSPIQIQSSDIVGTIKKVLLETALPAKHLEVEITEGILIEDEKIATDILKKIRNLGVLVSLDDFGTGYSSLSYLDRLHIDTVKIDRVFIVNIPGKMRSNLLLESIIKLVHNFDYKVVAEGVESKDQVDFINSIGCDKIQGYYYYRPMPFDDLIELINKPR